MADDERSAAASREATVVPEPMPLSVATRDFAVHLAPPPRIPLSEDAITHPHSPKRLPIRCLVVPTLKSPPKYEPITNFEGLPLYRLCSAVPYLLGSVSLLARIELIMENELDKVDKTLTGFYDLQGEFMSGPGSSGALMAILMALQMPEEERYNRGIWMVQGLVTEGISLRVYKDRSPQKPEVCHINLHDYVKLVRLWRLLPNPINVSCDHPLAKTSWSYIAARLREMGVDVSKIDKDLYQRLTMACHPENLEQELERVKEWSKSGELETRYDKWHKRSADLSGPSRPSIAATSTTQSSALYSKRYTHAHPRGITVEELQVLQRAEARKAEVLKEQEKDVEKADPEPEKPKTFKTKLRGFMGKFSLVAKMSIILLVFFALLGGLVYSMSSANTSDWTQGSDH